MHGKVTHAVQRSPSRHDTPRSTTGGPIRATIPRESGADTNPYWRVTVNFGFHRRRSVLGVAGGGIHNAPAVYDEERIRRRSRLIGYAIDARRQRFPEEMPFVYRPFAASGERHVWDARAKAGLRDYNLLDLSI